MMKTLMYNWNFSRVLRLSLGLIVLAQALMNSDTMLAIFALLFVAMPIFNIGCCSTGNCATNKRKATTEEINFEEIQ